MAISTVFWRPVNLLRSREVRASSRHTSLWGLARLSNAVDDNIKQAVVQNVAGRLSTTGIRPREFERLSAGMNPLVLRDAINRAKEPKIIFPSKLAEWGSLYLEYMGQQITNTFISDYTGKDLFRGFSAITIGLGLGIWATGSMDGAQWFRDWETTSGYKALAEFGMLATVPTVYYFLNKFDFVLIPIFHVVRTPFVPVKLALSTLRFGWNLAVNDLLMARCNLIKNFDVPGGGGSGRRVSSSGSNDGEDPFWFNH